MEDPVGKERLNLIPPSLLFLVPLNSYTIHPNAHGRNLKVTHGITGFFTLGSDLK